MKVLDYIYVSMLHTAGFLVCLKFQMFQFFDMFHLNSILVGPQMAVFPSFQCVFVHELYFFTVPSFIMSYFCSVLVGPQMAVFSCLPLRVKL